MELENLGFPKLQKAVMQIVNSEFKKYRWPKKCSKRKTGRHIAYMIYASRSTTKDVRPWEETWMAMELEHVALPGKFLLSTGTVDHHEGCLGAIQCGLGSTIKEPKSYTKLKSRVAELLDDQERTQSKANPPRM